MTREVVSLAGDTPLDTAAWRLASEAVSGAPVRDARGNLIGVLSKTDLVDLMREGFGTKQVADVMTPAIWAIHPDAPAIEAVELMLEKHIHRVLVVRGPGKLVGIVSAMDVMRALAGGGQFHPDDRGQWLRRDKKDEAPVGEEGDDQLQAAGSAK